MAAYVIADVKVEDADRYEEYRAQVAPTLERYGGEFLVRGGAHETLEGEWRPDRLVILRFESPEAARAWWSSPEYEGPRALRRSASEGSLVLVEGV